MINLLYWLLKNSQRPSALRDGATNDEELLTQAPVYRGEFTIESANEYISVPEKH